MTFAMSGGIKAAQTDDLGHFRLAGLTPGDYQVTAHTTPASTTRLHNGEVDLNGITSALPRTVYAPETFHKATATKFTRKTGEERNDVNISVNLTGLHSVSGRVSSATDHHGLNSGTVTLTDTADATFSRSASLNSDGTFIVTYLPSGSYTLKVTGAADTVLKPGKAVTGLLSFRGTDTLHTYAGVSQPAILAAHDVAGLDIELTQEPKPIP